jgi:hypothetical protein
VSRPFGVTIIAMLLLVSSGMTLVHALTPPAARRNQRLLIIATILAVVSLLAAEALWTLRSHAFLLYMCWAVCAMYATVATRFPMTSASHSLRLFTPIVCTGLAYAAAAIYLRRAL